MVEALRTIALIPARGGSKSIPRKNILAFAGHPLIAYSIAAGLAAESIEQSDRLNRRRGDCRGGAPLWSGGALPAPCRGVPDDTPDLPVFQHALRWLSDREGYQPDIVVQLRPTSPFRRVWHIDQAVASLIKRPDADAVRTVCTPFQNPFKMWRITPNGTMTPLMAVDGVTEPYNMPRQALPDVYWQTGYVDAAWAETILVKNSMTGSRILPLIIDPSEWIDIDSPDDWRRAERLLESGEITLDELGFKFT
jgi:CMP-N-acetylneuraminic acid synthetase